MTPSRGLHSDITTELAKGAYTSIQLVKITLGTVNDPVIYYYTDHTINIDVSGDSYIANGFILNLGVVKEDKKMSTGTMNLVVSAVNQTIISDVLTNGYIHKAVTIKRAYLNSANALISSNAVFTIYAGRISGMSITDSKQKSVISFKVENHWAFFNRYQGRRTTRNSMEEHFPLDKGFDWMQITNIGAAPNTKWTDTTP